MRDQKPAKVTLRMTPQLHAALTTSALAAGCSLNAFAIQVLAAAAGHRARFRAVETGDTTTEEKGVDLREMPRNSSGFPYERKARYAHLRARERWTNEMLKTQPIQGFIGERNRHDLEDPWFYVEWADAHG
jgi:hypothetical protein